MSKVISTEAAPAAIGPYSQAYEAAGLVFTSGQIAINPTTGKIDATDIAGQTEQICRNLTAVLAAAGCKPADVVKTTCFLADMDDFAVFNEIYGRYFPSRPARSCVAVKSLPKNALAEVEAVAEKKS